MWNCIKFEEVYTRYQSSHLSIRAFCYNEGILESKFYYWLRKIRHQPTVKSNGFIPVLLGHSQAPSAPPPPAAPVNRFRSYGCEIAYPGGTVLRLYDTVGTETLKELLPLNP